MKKLITIILIVLIQGCKDTKEPEINSIESEKKVIINEEGNEEFFFWELKDEKDLWEFDLGEVEALKQYQDSLKLALGSQNFESAVKKESAHDLKKSLIDEEENGDKINALLIHTGSIGEIRKINYLESQILNYQINRFPMFSHPTEFHGFITEKEGRIRVYFGASDTEWPPHPTILLTELEKEIKNGWKLIGHLHNHYCKKNENYVGILAPSLADAQYYKMLKERFELTEAMITNGFHTVAIESKDFEKFESH